MKNLFLYLLISFIGYLSPVVAQEHHLRHFTTEDGLPTNSVYGCIQDKAGYIWVFTEKGIAKFDGYTFKNYTVADGLPTNDVWDLTEDHLGRIWIQGYANEAAYIWHDSIFTIPKVQVYYRSIRPPMVEWHYLLGIIYFFIYLMEKNYQKRPVLIWSIKEMN